MADPISRLRLVSPGGQTEPDRTSVSPALARQILVWADETPDAPALISDNQIISFAMLAEHSERLTAQLRRQRVGIGEPIIVVAHKSVTTAALILSSLASQRPFLLVSPQLSPGQHELLALQSGCRWLLNPDRPQVSAVRAPVPLLSARPALDQVSFMLTTSGSTGVPKVVPLGHEQIDRFVSWATHFLSMGPSTTTLNIAPFNFDLCLLDVWSALAAGGTAVLVDPDRAMFGQHLLDQASRYHTTIVQAVPMFLALMLSSRAGHEGRSVAKRRQPRLPSVRHVLFTGDLIGESTLRGLPGLFPTAEFHNVYGCTETNDTFVATIADPASAGYPPPLGRPIDGIEHLVLGSDGRTISGPGTGELLVRSPFQTSGYTDPVLNGTKFVELTGPTGRRRYFRSGDIVRSDGAGTLTLVGRSDLQVKVRGVAVNLNEIEHTLLAHPDVRAAAVVAAGDELGGHRLVATVQRRGGSALGVVALRQHCARLLHRAAVPSVLQVGDDELPRTSTGKVDRQSLLRMAQAQQHHRPHLPAPGHRPTTPA